MEQNLNPGPEFDRLVEIMRRLRAPGGCPWDREQNFDTIKPYLLEEAYEVMDAIDARDWPALAEELGDLLLQPVFFAQMAAEAGHFTIADSLRAINEKLIRRHPHVFAAGDAKTAGDVKRRWRRSRRKKSRAKPGCSTGSPARCRRWSKPGRSLRAPPAPDSIGKMSSRFSKSSARKCKSCATPPAPTRSKAKSVICCSSSSTSRDFLTWTPSRRCAKPTRNSAAASRTSSAAWRRAAKARARPRSAK